MVDQAASPAPPAPKGQRRLLLLALTIVFGIGFGFVAAVTFAAWASSQLGAFGALVVGFVLAWLLPLVLAVRATLALKRQRRPVLLVRLVGLFLTGLVQLTVLAAGAFPLLEEEKLTARWAGAALPILGPIPVIGGVLEKHAKDGGVATGTGTTGTSTTGTGTDAGTGTTGTSTTGTGTTGTPTPVADGLSPRADGRTTATVAAVTTTTTGDLVVARYTVQFGGKTTVAVTSLAAHADKGAPTRVESSVDGHVVVVLAGQHTLHIAPGKEAALDASLSRGGKIADLEVQAVRDVAVGPGGDMLLAIDGFDAKKSAVVQALVARPKDGAPTIVRRAGTPIDDEEKVKGEVTNVTGGYAIKRGDGTGTVVVEEVIFEGGADVGTKLAGAQFAMNPRRLLVGRIDAPRALTELTRSGDEPSGLEGVSLQGFADAVALPDGRVVFDANFAEDGPRGWLMTARAGGSPFLISPELVGKDAPWLERAPRAKALHVEPEGTFAFSRDGGVVIGSLTRPAEALRGLVTGADVVRAGSGVVGAVARVHAPRLATGGEWLLAHVDVLEPSGQRREALVIASRADLTAKKVELLVIEGGAVPTSTPATPATPTTPTTPATPTTPTTPGAPATPAPPPATAPPAPAAPAATIKSLFVLEGHEEPLWGLP